uniref:Uncharacterized protein n=1 Tax=Magallana gigas TaxID=29159 RepID=A0A8W8NMF1_MAGGI
REGVIGGGRSRSTRREPTCPNGRPPYPITYSHCLSQGSNSGCSGDKRVHCPLTFPYLDTFFFLLFILTLFISFLFSMWDIL